MTPITMSPSGSERAPSDDSWGDAAGTPEPSASATMRQSQATLGAGELFGDGDEERTVVVSAAYELRPRFTGRSGALTTLHDKFVKSCELRQLAYCVVLGDSGMGKTRLVSEFCTAARATQPTTVLIAGSADEGGTPYAAVISALNDRFGILPIDHNDEIRDKILAGVAEVVQPARVPEVAHLLAHLMRVPFADSPIITPLIESPQRLESRTFMALRRFLSAESERHPVVFMIENLDLCGVETINLMQYLAVGAQNQRLMLLSTATPSLFERYPLFGQGDVTPHRVDLGPLTPGEAEELFRELCRPLDHVPERIVAHVRTLIDSPRSVHELVRLLLESGCIIRTGGGRSWRIDGVKAATMPLPRSYEELLASRLAAMDDTERRTLQIASVVGETCWFDAIVSVDRSAQTDTTDPDGPTLAQIAASGDHSRLATTAAIAKLIEHEWLVEIRDSALPGERELKFAYPTLWSLVYRGVEAQRKRGYHATVAEWLELHPDGRGPASQEEVARHLELAGEPREAALRYRRAAEAARAQFANERAIRLFDRALACIGNSDIAARIHLWHDLGSIYELIGDFEAALGAFERMLRLSWVVASKTKAAVAFNKMGRVWRRKGDLKLAVEYLERGLELFRAAGDGRGIASSLDDLGRAMHMLGRYDEAYQKITEGLARRGKGGDKRSIAASLSNLGTVQQERGQFEAAFNCHREALEMRRTAGDRWGQVASQNNLAALAFETDDYSLARSGWQSALSEAESIGALPLAALILTNLGELALTESKLEEARSRLDNALEIIDDIEDRHLETECCRHLAALDAQTGRLETATQFARRALDVAHRAGLVEREALAHIQLGEIMSANLYDADTGGSASGSPAAKAFATAVSLARSIGNDATLGRALFASGRFKAEQGQIADGRDLLRDALMVFSRLGLARQTGEVERLLSTLQ